MKNHVRIISALVLCVMILSLLTSCSIAEASWQRRWDAMVTKEIIKTNHVVIKCVDRFSCLAFPRIYELDTTKSADFVDFLRESNIVFDKFEIADDDRRAVQSRYASVILVNDLFVNSKDKYLYSVRFIVGGNEYVYLTPTEEFTGKYVIRSTEPIDSQKIFEFCRSGEQR